jgi:hypothetical protein
MDRIIIYILIVALLIGLPWIIDIFMAYITQNKMLGLLIKNAR